YPSLSPTRAHRHLHSFPTRRSSDLVSSSAWTRATRPSRSVVSVPIVRYAHHAPPPPPITSVITAAAASGPFHRRRGASARASTRSEEHTSELQSRFDLVCRLLLEKK